MPTYSLGAKEADHKLTDSFKVLILTVSIRLSLEEKSWWKMQVLYTGGVKSVSKEGAIPEGGSIQLFVWTCELRNCMLLELVNFMILELWTVV